MLKLRLLPLLSALLPLTVLAAPPLDIDDAAIRRAAVATFPDYLHFLTLPNISVGSGAGLDANAAWLQQALARRQFAVKVLPNKGKPLLVAERPIDPARKTILFYLHFDGQPVIPNQWAQASPFQPVVKQRDASGVWQIVDSKLLLRPDFDPELRVFGRSSSDDKGPIMMLLTALDMLDARKLTPAVNVRLLLDAEEEIGSPSLPEAVQQAGTALQADALVIVDAATHPSGRPTAMFGNRGALSATLTVYGPNAPLHSGHYGNYVPNPAHRLARLLAAMKDDTGRVTITGYYARTQLSAEERQLLADSNLDETALRRRVGIASTDTVGSNYMESIQYPSLNIRGMAAADIGDKAANIIPKDAVAELDLRTTAESDSDYLAGLLRNFIIAQGYTVLDHAPDAAERTAHPKLARLDFGLPSAGARQAMDTPIRYWVERALASAYPATQPPILMRASGGTVPTHEITEPLRLPFVLVPLVNPDNNQHTFDENLRMGNYLTGVRSLLGLLTTSYP